MREASVLRQGPLEVVGYHGCRQDVAEHILAGASWLPSANGYDWLGEGIYFWEYAPFRAYEWAQARFGKEGTVLRATILLGHCLNLLDVFHFAGLQMAYDLTVTRMQESSLSLPRNTRSGQHYLDRVVVDAYCRDWALVVGSPFQSVRGCFPEGAPVYEGSRLLRETHVQVTVRDVTCISGVEQIDFTEMSAEKGE